jgi:integrase
VRIRGRVRYLGKYGSPESKEAYRRALAELEVAPVAVTFPSPSDRPRVNLTIVEICAAYIDFAERYYVKNGQPTAYIGHVHRAVRILNDLYGHTRAVDFGPLALRAIQEHMLQHPPLHPQTKQSCTPYCRKTINYTLASIKRLMRWAVSHELVPATVDHALATVPGLKRGRCDARESPPVGPVSEAVIEATLPYVSPIVASMIRLQRATGMRPGELIQLRPMDLDRSGKVWRYVPASHKTEHRDRQRVVFLGPRAQRVLLPYLLRPADAYCFSPAESEEKRHGEMRERRRTKVQPSQQHRRKRRPQRGPTLRYSVGSYRRAITKGTTRANRQIQQEAAREGIEPQLVPDWSPGQLRHSAATEIRQRFNLEAAQVILGHAKADVTQVYAERDFALAAAVMEKIG